MDTNFQEILNPSYDMAWHFFVLLTGVAAQVPAGPPVYQMNLSTIIMP